MKAEQRIMARWNIERRRYERPDGTPLTAAERKAVGAYVLKVCKESGPGRAVYEIPLMDSKL